MYYSLSTIVQSLPAKKNSKSSLWVKLIVRRLSFLFTWFFINLKCSAWTVSMISAIVALVGSFALCLEQSYFQIIGVVLIELWLILDCVDGNIARVKKTSSEYGEFVDALSGYYVTGFVFVGIGVAAYHTSHLKLLTPDNYITLGGISAIAGLLSRIVHQKYTYTILMIKGKDGIPEKEVENKKSLQYLRSRIDKEIGISGLFMPFLIIACVFKLYDIMTLFYISFQFIGLIAVTSVYSLKAKQ